MAPHLGGKFCRQLARARRLRTGHIAGRTGVDVERAQILESLVDERLEVGPNAELDLARGVALRLNDAPGIRRLQAEAGVRE